MLEHEQLGLMLLITFILVRLFCEECMVSLIDELISNRFA